MHSGNTNGTKLPVEILTDDEVSALLSQCGRRSATGPRNRALIAVLYRCQLRISEAVALRPSDIGDDQINVRHGKGNKQRFVSVDPVTLAEIAAWMAVRAFNGHKPVFCTLQGERLKTAYVRALLPRLAKRAGITKRVHPHGLRHSGASALLDRGGEISDIQAQLGHSAPSVTDRYLHQVNPLGRAKRLAALWTESEVPPVEHSLPTPVDRRHFFIG